MNASSKNQYIYLRLTVIEILMQYSILVYSYIIILCMLWKSFTQNMKIYLNPDFHLMCSHNYTVYVSFISKINFSLYSSNLTWRDIQYLVAYTSNPDSLVGGDWNWNAAGLSVSHKFGFGAIDAEAMVTRAKRWINVPQQISEEFQGSVSFG